jgi:general secretion pathway protein N
MNTRSLLAVGIGAFLVFALVTLPANVVIPRVQPEGITLAGLDGSVWNGSAQVLQIGGMHAGSVNWRLKPWALVTGRAAADIQLKRTDGFAQGEVRIGTHRIELEEFSASLPLSLLPPQLAPRGWTGTVNLRLAELTLVDQWPVSADGTVDLVNLTSTAQAAPLGTYRIQFPLQTDDPNTLAGSINDVEAVIKVSGKIELRSDRSYLLDTLVAAEPNAPSDFVRTLEILGPPDAQGRRIYRQEGTM